MQVIIHEAALPVIEQRGFRLAQLLGSASIAALLAGGVGLYAGATLGAQQKEREMKERYGIVESTPLTGGPVPIPGGPVPITGGPVPIPGGPVPIIRPAPTP